MMICEKQLRKDIQDYFIGLIKKGKTKVDITEIHADIQEIIVRQDGYVESHEVKTMPEWKEAMMKQFTRVE